MLYKNTLSVYMYIYKHILVYLHARIHTIMPSILRGIGTEKAWYLRIILQLPLHGIPNTYV